jgi:peptidoglycan-associated lipoprotein
MPLRYLRHGTVVVLAVAAVLLGGCGRKIVHQPLPGAPGMDAPRVSGPLMEQDVQSVQASLKPVHFDYDQFTMTSEAQAAAQYDAEILKRAPQVAVLIEGHCDERGTDEYNLALGERRAQAVAQYLTTLGVSNRMSTVSYGSELPADPGHNEAAWAKNRRAELRVSK